METEVRWSFDYMIRDIVCTHVDVMSDLTIRFENYVDDPMWCAFGTSKTANISALNEFMEDRCFPRTRFNCDEILRSMGLKKYDPYSIVRITHGAMVHDLRWIRFEGETLTWDDVCRLYRFGVKNR